MSDTEKLAALKVPFAPSEIDWRIGQSGKTAEGKWWATCLAYITGRAVQDRLDAVLGGENWKVEYKEWGIGTPGVLCGLSLRINGEWITKWDGADQPDTEPMKGGLSNALKRAAVPWGIGRYLYDLPKTWADIREDGTLRAELTQKKGKEVLAREWVKWNPPPLPAWAIPEGSPAPHPPLALPVQAAKPNGQPPKAQEPPAGCPKCGGAFYDNRGSKKNPKAPDFKCKEEKGTCKDKSGKFPFGWWEEKDDVTSAAKPFNVPSGVGPGMPGAFDAPPDFGPEDDAGGRW